MNLSVRRTHPLCCLMVLWGMALLLGCSAGKVGDPDETPDGTDVENNTDVTTDGTASDASTDQPQPDVTIDTVPDGTPECASNTTRCEAGNVETCLGGTWMVTEMCQNACSGGECTSNAPIGTCDMPLPLSVGQTVVGTTDTITNTNTWSNECTSDYGYNTVGPETVYELTVDSMQPLEFEVSGIDQNHFGLFIRSDCGSPGTMLHSACNGTQSPGGQFTVKTILSPGTYYVFVDSFEIDDTGQFQLAVNQTVMDSCANQIPELIDISGGPQTVTGDTSTSSNFAHWVQQGCPNQAIDSTGPENVYAFSLSQPGNVHIEARPTNPDNSKIGIYIRTECEDRFSQVGLPSDTFGCGYTDGSGTAVIDTTLDPGPYYLFVDDFPTSIDETQEYELTISGP